MTELEHAIKHIKTRADAWAVKEVTEALRSISERLEKALLQEPCDDAISDIMGISKSRTHDIMENELRCVQTASCGGCDRECGECSLLMDDKEIIKAYGYVIRMLELPSVTQKPKMGHWIRWREDFEYIERNYTESIPHCKCSECDKEYDTYASRFINYCPNCGARMVEPQESEDKYGNI